MGGIGSGRKKRTVELANCGQIFAAAAPFCAQYLSDVIRGEVKKPSWARIDVCKFIIEHVVGKAKIKAEITGPGGAPLTWQGLIMLAEEAEKEGGPPKIVGGVHLIPVAASKPPEDRGGGEAEPEGVD